MVGVRAALGVVEDHDTCGRDTYGNSARRGDSSHARRGDQLDERRHAEVQAAAAADSINGDR